MPHGDEKDFIGRTGKSASNPSEKKALFVEGPVLLDCIVPGVQQSAAMCSNVQQSAAECSNVQQSAAFRFSRRVRCERRRKILKEDAAVRIATAKRSDTAELRKRFGSITALLADGYNHKQICAHLNTQGLAIPYPQYRAIMTRLRREAEKDAKLMPLVAHSIQSASAAPLQRTGEVSLVEQIKENSQVQQEKRISWDPMSQVKWK